jgi:hypothetical protein
VEVAGAISVLALASEVTLRWCVFKGHGYFESFCKSFSRKVLSPEIIKHHIFR